MPVQPPRRTTTPGAHGRLGPLGARLVVAIVATTAVSVLLVAAPAGAGDLPTAGPFVVHEAPSR
ncbi:hypothetical protein [Arthrobacter sp. NEB 688]|uniref:hypothetical protein n=1 Tax=Arthrobacter sp. NEB 688 TaxID=904039 RepID=UPI0015669849|nr:hypothetical protein [Arthrobacter sp. NEB 688]QKE85699.1 hypothetical protein HL663_18440 [Arthrobacter sp. NEB 688]